MSSARTPRSLRRPLRARVHDLAQQPARRLVPPRRRTALALTFVLLAFAVAGSMAVLRGDDERSAAPAGASELQKGGKTALPLRAAPEEPAFRSNGTRMGALSSANEAAEGSLVPRGRATDVNFWLEVRLPGADELSAAASEAMSITREFGGRVAASDIDTEGNEGRAELALRVPVGRVEDAVVQLGDLGTVTGERVATVDLQSGIDRRAVRIEQLERAIRVLQLRLESGTLTPEDELRARLQVERHENEIDDLEAANLAAREEAAMSELTLALHTREPAATQGEDEGGAAGAARDALDFLATAGTIALFVLIVLSPIVLLLVLLWLAFRARSRRVEARLLDRPDPASPPSA